MSIDATRWAWMQHGLRPSEKLTLLALADRADDNDEAWPSVRRLEMDTGLNRKTLPAALRALARHRMIVDTGRTKGKTGRVKVWKLLGVEHREKCAQKWVDMKNEPPEPASDGALSAPDFQSAQKRADSKKGDQNDTENGGIVPNDGRVIGPKTDSNRPENGPTKCAQKRAIEPTNRNLPENQENAPPAEAGRAALSRGSGSEVDDDIETWETAGYQSESDYRAARSSMAEPHRRRLRDLGLDLPKLGNDRSG